MNSKITEGSNLMWESSRMILPEWREAYMKALTELEKTEAPAMDEQAWEELGLVISASFDNYFPIILTVYEDGFYNDVFGVCTMIHYEKKEVTLKVGDAAEVIQMEHIKDARMM